MLGDALRENPAPPTRCFGDGSTRTSHVYTLFLRVKGSLHRAPDLSGGRTKYRLLAKRASTPSLSQSWSTDMSVSVNSGMSRTPRMISERFLPSRSRAITGKSPMK